MAQSGYGYLFCVTGNSCILNYQISCDRLIIVNNPELNNLPPIKLIALDGESTSFPGPKLGLEF